MAYSHRPEPRSGQGPGIKGLCETVWTFAHYTWTRITPEPGQGLKPIVSHCSDPGPCSCLGPGSASVNTPLVSYNCGL